MFHIRRKPFLRISSAADMIIGKQKDGILGRCVDVVLHPRPAVLVPP